MEEKKTLEELAQPLKNWLVEHNDEVPSSKIVIDKYSVVVIQEIMGGSLNKAIEEQKQEENDQKCEPFRIKKGEWYVCIHDFLNKAIRIGEIIQAEHDNTIRGFGFLYMENKYFRPAFENEIPQKPKWTDEDEAHLHSITTHLEQWIERHPNTYGADIQWENLAWLKSLKQRMEEQEPKPKVKYAGNEYNVLEVKDIAGVMFYGIEDEPNHIDYVKAENCEIISCYTIKENGSSYPTKPAVFSEQKCADKVEQKFHEGDWVVYKNDICQIVKREEGCNKLVTVFGIEKELVNERNLSTAHLWTINDAKDGDVLSCEDGWTCIFKSLNDDDTFCSYCFMDSTKWFCEKGSECHTLNTEYMKAYHGEIKPATKEQRDTLMKAMADVGYTFDFEKKELKKIEQNLASSAKKTCKNDSLLDLLNKMPSCITVDGIDYHFVLKKAVFYRAYYEGEGEEGSGKVIFGVTAYSPIDLLTEILDKLKEEGLLE